MSYKFNPFINELDLVNPDNFSFETIADGKNVRIPTNQQMLVYEEITIDGTLVIDGELIIFDTKPLYRIIDSATTESINIELYEMIRLTASGITTSLNGVVTGSKITVTNRSGGDSTLNITVQGNASPILRDLESFSLVYNGTDYDFT